MKLTIYQTLPRLFGASGRKNIKDGSMHQNGCGHLADYTPKALRAIRAMGCNAIWYTGVIEHATKEDFTAFGIENDNPQVVKGNAGSPYAIRDYYDIDPCLAKDVPNRMREFEELVARTHDAGLKMIIDFVPNHVARQYRSDAKPMGVVDLGADDDRTMAFHKHNNFYYLPGETLHCPSGTEPQNHPTVKGKPASLTECTPYEETPAKVTGNDCFSAWPSRNDWYETVKLNYGVDYQGGHACHFFDDDKPDTWHKMLDILRFWATKGVDGFRCDMAEMVPVEFWGWAIGQIKSEHPGIIFIAEVYNPAEYRNYIHRGFFDYLYDKVGLYDTLKAVTQGASASLITQCWQSVDDISAHMLNFLENHDEQRIASPFFAGSPAKGRPALLVSALMRSNPFMVYQGQALGEDGMEEAGFSGADGRTTIFDFWTLDKTKRWRNGGKLDGSRLTDEECELLDYHRKVLTLATSEAALADGEMFDLMYVNYDNPLMDTNRQYAFLRKSADETILVVANFSDQTTKTALVIPSHAFNHLAIKPGRRTATDLLTGKTKRIDLTPGTPLPLTLPSQGGLILKF